MGFCRSCEERVEWALMAGSGKHVPLDLPPATNGNIVQVGTQADGVPLVRVLKRNEEPPAGALRYRIHFVSCSAADHWRKKARA